MKAKTQEFRSLFDPIRLAFVAEKDRIENDISLSLDEKNTALEKNNKRYIESRENMVQKIRFEALALHRRASELIFGQEFTLSNGEKKVWNMIPYDVQFL